MKVSAQLLKINPLMAGAAVSVVLGLVGVGAITGVLPSALSQKQSDTPQAQADAGTSAQPSKCAICGTVEAIRSVEARRDASGIPTYRVTVRMDDGSYRAVSLAGPPGFAVGDKVRVVEGKLIRA